MNKKILENFHVLLWLIKDVCWAMDLKILGAIMVLPTLAAAFWILIITKKQIDFWVNLSVLFWILANSTWMTLEFFSKGEVYYSLPFFIAGIVSFLLYIYQLYRISHERR